MPEYGTTTTPAAGWYPDPAGGTLERWWGGVEWTETTRPIPIVQAAPEPAFAGVPGGGTNPFAVEAAPSWGASSTPVTQAQSVGSYHAVQAVAGPPKVSAGWYDQGRIAQAQPTENPAATRALVFGIISWFINPLLIFSILGLRSAKRGLENAQMFVYERREPTGRGSAKAGRVLSAVSLVAGILYFACVGVGLYLFTSYHDFVIEGLWASQASAEGIPGSTLDCPAEGSYDPGSSFVCTVTLADGRSGDLKVTINNLYAGDITVEPVR